MSDRLIRPTVAMLMFMLAGCAGTPAMSTGERMRAHAVDEQTQVNLKNKLAKDWDRGNKLVEAGEDRIESGEKRIKSGEKDIKKGRAQIERGNEEIAEGHALVREADQRFQERFPEAELKHGG